MSKSSRSSSHLTDVECRDKALEKLENVFKKGKLYWTLILVNIGLILTIFLILLAVVAKSGSLSGLFGISVVSVICTIIVITFLVLDILVCVNMFDLDRYLSRHDCGWLDDVSDDLASLKLTWLVCMLMQYILPFLALPAMIVKLCKWRRFKREWFDKFQDFSGVKY